MNHVAMSIFVASSILFSARGDATSLPHRDYGTWHSSVFGGGGYLQNVVIAPSDPDTLYIYVDVGGVYRSRDGGLTWRMMHGGMPPGDGYYSVRGLTINPLDADDVTIAVGNQWSPRQGLYRSRDGGESWEQVLEAHFYGNEPHRATGMIFARDGLGRLHAGSAGDGIWVSEDEGATWSKRGLDGVNIIDLKFMTDGRGWVCAQAWTPHQKGELAGGFFITRNHGEDWEALAGPVPDELVIDSAGALAGIFDASRIMRSTDDGLTWTEYSEGLPVDAAAATGWTSEHRFRALTAGPDFILTGSSRGTIYQRKLDDLAWRKIEREQVTEVVEGQPWWGRLKPGAWPHFGAALGSLTVVPGNPGHWWFTDWYSAYKTTDAGRTWTQHIDGIEVTVIHHILGNPTDPARVHAGMADNAYAQSLDGGARYDLPRKTFSNLKMLGISPTLPGRLYAVGDRQAAWRAEQIWVSVNSGLDWVASPMSGLPPAAQHSFNSIVVHAERPYEVWVTASGAVGDGGGVYRSVDGGQSFVAVNDGLEGAGALFRHEIWSIGPELAMARSGHLVAASHETGRLYFYDGARWQNASDQPAGKPRYLASNGEVFYVACGEGGTLKSEDGGRRWTAVLEDQSMVVAADPERPDLVAVATVDRILISIDGGACWVAHPLPPHGQVRTLAFAGQRLHAGTSGGGMFWMPLHAEGRLSMVANDSALAGVLPVAENVAAQAPDITPALLEPDAIASRWSTWTGQGTIEKTWDEASYDATAGSLLLRSLSGYANGSAGLNVEPVSNTFQLTFAWKTSGDSPLETQIALRSYRNGAQVDWQTLAQYKGASPEWTYVARDVRFAEGADRGEVVVVLKGDGAIWLDALSASIPVQIFGTPVE